MVSCGVAGKRLGAGLGEGFSALVNRQQSIVQGQRNPRCRVNKKCFNTSEKGTCSESTIKVTTEYEKTDSVLHYFSLSHGPELLYNGGP